MRKPTMKHKIFKERASLYDRLTQTNPFIYCSYQVFKFLLILILLYVVVRDSFEAGRLWLDLSTFLSISGPFKGWLLLLGLEISLLALFLLLYPVFHLWRRSRNKFGRAADIIYLLSLCFYVFVSFYMLFEASWAGMSGKIPRTIAVIECSRLVIKTISFVRDNAYKELYPWNKDDEKGPAKWYEGQMSPRVASFSQYVYFLVAPTLVYRDHYPRNKNSINWKNVVAYGLQFTMLCIVCQELFMEQYPKSFKIGDLVLTYVKMILLSPVMYFLGSLTILHAWFNLTAELTRFADREFYLSWWSAVGYTEWYRLWNVPIHDFTTTYIYKSLKPHVHRAVAGLVVFVLSAFMHDLIIGFTMGFFLPVFLLLFAVVGGIVFATGVKFPVSLTFIFHCVGYVIYMGVYYLELGARYYCRPEKDLPFLALQMFHCFQVHNGVTSN